MRVSHIPYMFGLQTYTGWEIEKNICFKYYQGPCPSKWRGHRSHDYFDETASSRLYTFVLHGNLLKRRHEVKTVKGFHVKQNSSSLVSACGSNQSRQPQYNMDLVFSVSVQFFFCPPEVPCKPDSHRPQWQLTFVLLETAFTLCC